MEKPWFKASSDAEIGHPISDDTAPEGRMFTGK